MTCPVETEPYLKIFCKAEGATLTTTNNKLEAAQHFIDGADVLIAKDQGETVVTHSLLLRKVEYGVRNTWGSNAHPVVCGPIKLFYQDPQTGYMSTKAIGGSFIKKFFIIKYP